jgi:hypothetical protein
VALHISKQGHPLGFFSQAILHGTTPFMTQVFAKAILEKIRILSHRLMFFGKKTHSGGILLLCDITWMHKRRVYKNTIQRDHFMMLEVQSLYQQDIQPHNINIRLYFVGLGFVMSRKKAIN